jgi:hypothetical protein
MVFIASVVCSQDDVQMVKPNTIVQEFCPRRVKEHWKIL